MTLTPLAADFTLDDLQAAIDAHHAVGRLKALVFPTIDGYNRYVNLCLREPWPDESVAVVPAVVPEYPTWVGIRERVPLGHVGLLL